MTFQLLCEGRCNPLLATADQELRKQYHPGATVIPGDHLVRLQRSLRYTPHRMTAPTMAQCEMCHTERRYGGQTW